MGTDQKIGEGNMRNGNPTPWCLISLTWAMLFMAFPAFSASFDCARARTDAELAVCSDEELSALDDRMGSLIRKLVAESPDPEKLKASQIEWARAAGECGSDVECLKTSYAERFQTLLAPVDVAASDEHPSELVVDDAPPTQVVDTPQAEPPVERPRSEASTTTGAPADQRSVETIGVPNLPRSTLAAALVVGLIGLVVISVLATKAVAEHSTRKYGWPLILNWWNALYIVGFGSLAFFGSMGADGVVTGLMIVGVIWLVMLAVNVSKTSLATGLVMTLIQPFVAALLWVLFGLARAQSGGRRT